MPIATGSELGHYTVTAFIGQGGMGEVYRAHDSRLRRDVAIKVLPADFASDRSRIQRFEREARAILALNHPNIVTLFDFGQADGHYFMATEFVDGMTLRAQLRERRRWTIDEVLPIVLQCAAALALDPNNPSVLQWRGVHLLAMGRGDEAVELHRRSVAIDPIDLVVRSQLCRALYLTRRYDEAVATGRSLLQMDPNMSAAHQFVGQSLSELGRHGEALPALEQAVALAPGNSERIAALAHGYALAGRVAEARKRMTQLQAPSAGFGNAYHLATIASGLHDTESALKWLEEARQNREPMLANRVKIDPKLDLIRSDQRFLDLLRQMRLDR